MSSTAVDRLLAAGLLCVAASGVAAAAPDCRARTPALLLERFVPADCERCWRTATPRDRQPGALLLDWVTPAGVDAPMAGAALDEATARAGPTAPQETAYRATPLERRGAPLLRITDGPGWNGYVGLRLVVTRRAPVPADAVAYVALVERVPAGSEGSPVERQLVRAVAGPMGLGELATERKIEHLRAVRLPQTDRADRLASVAWIETAQGRVIAAAQAPPPECR